MTVLVAIWGRLIGDRRVAGWSCRSSAGWVVLAGAGGAESDDREVREASLVSEQFPDLVADRVELLPCERADRSATLA
jgi:hypothetical protein